VDIILIEPNPQASQTLSDSMMRYSTRLAAARYGFESVTLDLAEDYAGYKQILARHGIPISRRLVIEEIAEIQQSNYDSAVIRRILEARPARCTAHRRGGALCRLDRALADLEITLNQLAQ
jgi:hypothetical protein